MSVIDARRGDRSRRGLACAIRAFRYIGATVGMLAVSSGCRGERLAGTRAARFSGSARIVLQSMVDEPAARTLDLTAFTSVSGRRISLGELRTPIDTGRRNVPFTVDLAPCFGADTSASPTCALSLSGVLRDSTSEPLDSAQIGPVVLQLSDSVANFPPLNLRRVARIQIGATATRVVIGDTTRLTATLFGVDNSALSTSRVTWTSADTTIATVTSAGVVVALRPGRIAIRASRDGLAADDTITVLGIGRILISPSIPRLAIGDTVQLSATLLDSSGAVLPSTRVTWASADTLRARVSATGRAIGVRPGVVAITATRNGSVGTDSISVPFQAVVRWTFSSTQLPPGFHPYAHIAAEAVGPNLIYVLTGGSIDSFDGTNFSRVINLPIGAGTMAVRSATDMVVAGSDGSLATISGSTATRQTSGVTTDLLVAAPGGPDGYIVAGVNGVVLSGSGSSWRPMSLGTQRAFTAACGSPSTGVFLGTDSTTTIFRLVGATWISTPLPVAGASSIRSLYCADSVNVFAAAATPVGWRLLHFNGSSWTSITVPPAITNVNKVTGSSATDIYVVGACSSYGRFDGVNWQVFAPLRDCWSNEVVTAAAAGNNVIAAGYDGGFFTFRNGAWSELSFAPVYLDAFALSPTFSLAVGRFGTIDRFDGTTWTAMNSGTGATLFGVWAASSNDAYAVGALGQTFRWNGAQWLPLPSPPMTGTLLRVWGTSATNVIAAGEQGRIQTFNGSAWTVVQTGLFNAMIAIWGSGPNDVFVVGSGGVIYHYDGASWQAMQSGTTRTLHGVWGSGPTDVWAVGEAETILRYDGSRWRTEQTGGPGTFLQVWGSNRDDVYISGCGTRYEPPTPSLRWDGVRYRQSALWCSRAVTGLPAPFGGMLAVGGRQGVLFGLNANDRYGARLAGSPILSR